MAQSTIGPSDAIGGQILPAALPDMPPLAGPLDPPAALAFRTPLQEHAPAADTKAGAILTLLGLMFTLLARYGAELSRTLDGQNNERWVLLGLLAVFSTLALATTVQAFRTISPRFPKAPPSLAFFGDIARLSREEYLATVEGLSHERALDEMLNYNYTLSLICVAKFTVLRSAIRLFKLAVLCWLGLMLLLNTRVFF